SGGPLVDLAAEAVGINTFISVGAGGAIGFAIPIDQAVAVAHMLIGEERASYPYLGARVGAVGEVPPDGPRAMGAVAAEGGLLIDVAPGSPAALAGLRAGDVITSVEGAAVTCAGDVLAELRARPVGTDLAFHVLRGGEPVEARVTRAALPPR